MSSKIRKKTPGYFNWLKTIGGVVPPPGPPPAGPPPPPPTPPPTLTFTTTLAALTGHNISDSASYNKANHPTLFTGTSHKFSAGNGSAITSFAVDSTKMDDSQNAAAPLNVSKVNLHTLMPAGWPGKIINYGQFWWGGTSHPNIGYSDVDPATMTAIMKDSASRGYDVVCFDWYGQNVGNGDKVQDLITANCASTGQTFAMMIDQQYFGDNGFNTASTMQTGLAQALNHFATKYYPSPSYERMTVGGVSRPLVLLWDVAGHVGANVNWTQLKTQINGNPLLIQYQAGGFSVTATDGAFAWNDPFAPFNSGVKDGTTYLTSSFLPACTSHQSLICISSACKGFNGTLTKSTAWSDGKFIDQQNGQTWLNWWKANANYVNAGHRLDYIGVVTWDDFQEGSPVQPGILNNVGFTSTQVNGTILSWAIAGNENTVSKYDVYITPDGVNLAKLTSLGTNVAKTVDLSTFTIPTGTYSVYVQAVGQPCIVNRTSIGVAFTKH
jgi:hypothetical protein